MKKLIFTLLLSAATLVGSAVDFTVDGIAFNKLTGSNVAVAKASYSGAINIPATVSYNNVTYTVTEIAAAAFQNASGVTSVTMPNTLTTIGNDAFYGCTSLSTIEIPKNVKTLGTKGILGKCTSLQNITVEDGNTSFASYKGLLYNIELKKLINVPCGRTDIKLAGTTTTIGQYSFAGHATITTLIIPKNVTSIQSYAFQGCKSLTTTTCRAAIPPTATNMSFPTEMLAGKLLVSEEAIDLYKAKSPWYAFKTIEVDPTIPKTPDYAASISTLNAQNKCAAGKKLVSRILVTNTGKLPMDSLTYTYTVDGKNLKTASTKTEEVVAPAKNGYAIFRFDPITSTGQHELSMTISQVNGIDNVEEDRTATHTFTVVDANDAIPAGAYKMSFTTCANNTTVGKSSGKSYEAASNYYNKKYDGMKVVGAKLCGLQEVGLGSLYFWNSSSLSSLTYGNPPAKIDAYQEDDSVRVLFPTPVAYNSTSPHYFGVGMTVLPEGSPFAMPLAAPKGYSSVKLRGQGEGWSEVGSMGNLCLTLYLTGNLKEAELEVNSLAVNPIVMPGVPAEASFYLFNHGAKDIKSIEYSVTYGGKTQTKQLELDEAIPQLLLYRNELTLPLGTFANPGSQPVTLTITKVNGVENLSAAKSLNFNVNVASFATVHRPILEENTGTGCGYCPRGTLGLTEMKKHYPQFIAAAYHRYNSTDPMYTNTPVPFAATGAPECAIDRGPSIDPYFGSTNTSFGIAKDYEAARSILAPADLGLKATWGQDSIINVETTAKFAFVESGATYKIGYLVTADSLGDPKSPAWEQANYYSGTYQGDDPVYATIYPGGGFDMSVYNHVLIHGTYYKGVDGSLASSLQPNTDYTHTQAISLKGNELAKQTNQIHVIALLLDQNGKVRNAREVRVGDEVATGIGSISESASGKAAYYELMGRRAQNPQKGIYVRVQDGRASKVAL